MIGGGGADPAASNDSAAEGDEEPLVSCSFSRGTIAVYADRVVIERADGSMFEDVTIPMGSVDGVGFTPGVLTGHLQVRQAGVDLDDGGRLSHPVDRNTLHFSRTDRECARRARDAVLEHSGGAGDT